MEYINTHHFVLIIRSPHTYTLIMADLLTPSSVTMTTINATADKPKTPEIVEMVPKSKPERPDEQKYKEDLAKAEKEHAVAMEKVVRRGSSSYRHFTFDLL